MLCNYLTDLNKQYFRRPYTAQLDPGETNPIVKAFNPIDLIPQSIFANLIFEDSPTCPFRGITSRYIKALDINGNAYLIDVPVPFSLALKQEIESDFRIFSFQFFGERIQPYLVERII